MWYKEYLIVFFFFISFSRFSYTQEIYIDTLKITIEEADSTFLSRNLLLLAEKFNVEAAKALILQNRLWNNPNISVNQLVLNTEYTTNGGRKWFDMTNNGETNAQIQQLLFLAGKRNKRINMAELNATREEQTYFDLLRTLKFSLRNEFYNIYFLQVILRVYDNEIKSLSQVIKVFQNQLDKGYVSMKEVLRLKSALMSLESEKTGFNTQLTGDLSEFNLLMHTFNIYYCPEADTSLLFRFSANSIKLLSIIDTAFIYRNDLKTAKIDLNLSQINLTYQKALAIPDLSVIAGWDRNGSYVHNYNYLGLSIDLPFFNRNQGSIRSASYSFESSKIKLQSAEDQVRSDVINAYAALMENQRLYLKFDRRFVCDLETLTHDMLINYEKRNISLLEFIDFYDAYRQNMVQLNTLQNNLVNSYENLNFSVGKELVRY